MRPEWEGRLNHWISALEREFYEPLDVIPFEGYRTYDMLRQEEAEKQTYTKMPEGTKWGRTWEYCWMRSDIVLDERAQNKRIVMDLLQGGEASVYVNGMEFGTRRAEWVGCRHHYICDQVLSLKGKKGDTFHLLVEAYAGHDFPDVGGCATGPIRVGTEDCAMPPEEQVRQTVGHTTYGIWHEEAYQLWLDVVTLKDTYQAIDAKSLRAAKIEEALETFTLMVDFEQERAKRIEDYVKARAMLAPYMQAENGSTMPEFTAVGNAHLDLSWLWPYRETERKVLRTFAQQVRLMDMYPEYRFIQSQPDSYRICKEKYPALYARIQEKVKKGQWIADGSMWVEPDTNMTSGESLIRQVVYGKRFYKEEFDVDCKLLWLPDTFGYSAVLPQILQGCHVEYLTTQKIFWTYNGSDKFPYHYFTWQGMDGSKITSFLHMDYTSKTDAKTVVERWDERVQKRDLDKFFLPFGYGDGGGGPTRDHIEYILREKNLEGVPRVKMDAPTPFFEEMKQQGAPKNTYVGELYFQCHRGTYTSQAAVKKGNRVCENILREAEVWSSLLDKDNTENYAVLEDAWKEVLLNQFHDILPGSSIACVYEEAQKRYDKVKLNAGNIIQNTLKKQTKQEGNTYFNSLSFDRDALVKTDKGYGVAHIPAFGFTSEVTYDAPQKGVTVQEENNTFVLQNAFVKATFNSAGEMLSLKDKMGKERISNKSNVIKVYKDTPRMFDAWDIDSMYDMSPVDIAHEGTFEIVENTPFRATVQVTRTILSSTFVQNISLDYNSAQIVFATEADFHERHRLFKVDFETGIHTEEGINEIQFGYVKRPTHRSRPYDQDRFEVCNHRYTALTDENRGAAVLNDCKYGVSMEEDKISLTLLRGATSPDLHADQGKHAFTYSYYVWDGAFVDSDVVQKAYEMNVPVRVAEGKADTTRLLSLSNSTVFVDTVKQAEDKSDDLIVRLYESKHASQDVTLQMHFDVKNVYQADMLENIETELPVNKDAVSLTFRPFEIKTLRIKR